MDRKPWMCDDAVNFLASIVVGARVFEYGGGGSSLWLMERAREVVTVDHSSTWAARITKEGQGDVEVILQPDLEKYPREIEGRGEFDVVIVDGRERNECIGAALETVAVQGWVVLDDSERSAYAESKALLGGWRSVVKEGMKSGSLPGQIVKTQTTFYQKPR